MARLASQQMQLLSSRLSWQRCVPYAGLAALLAGVFTIWPGSATQIASQDFLPQIYCYLGNKQLWMLQVVSDSLIFMSYLAISCTLAWLLHREKHLIPFGWIFVAFGFFLVACGFTHLMEVIVLWRPFYWLSGDLKLITAVSSVITAGVLPFLVPRAGMLLERAQTSQQNERRFLAASANSSDGIFILDSVRDAMGEIVDFRFEFVNTVGARSISSTPQGLRGTLLCATYPLSRTDGYFDLCKRVVDTGAAAEMEQVIDAAAARTSWLHLRVTQLEDGVAVTSTDVGSRKRKLEEHRLATFTQSIIASSPFATVVTDLEGTITSVNPAAERLLGYSGEDLIGRESPLLFLDVEAVTLRAATLSEELGSSVEAGMAVLTAKPSRGLVDEGEWKLKRRDGTEVDACLTVSAMKSPSGAVIGLILMAYDITERKRVESYVANLAHHDALTGLPTRTLLRDRLGVQLKHAVRHDSKFAVLMVDLDNFKRVNDQLGHHAGDEMLMEVASRLKTAVRESDTVARLGGDEFVILLGDLHSLEEGEIIAAKVCAFVSEPLMVGSHTLNPTASIGICVYPDNGTSDEELLKNADEAMYRVKIEGRNGFKTFTPEMATASFKKRQLEAGLQEAIARKELELVYQPQISLRTGKVTGVEALLRWRSTRLGMVMPNDFIALAEESGLIVPIGEWVLMTACREGRQLQLETGRDLTIAVNISPRQFQQAGLAMMIRRILEECHMPPASLELEITENVLVADSPKAASVLEEVRAMGVRVALDDFGTGFSSMSYIMRFRVDRLKIDQSFIRDIATDSGSRAVTTAVLALADGLKIGGIAEGVETSAHRDLLMTTGCEEAQGFFYSRPVSAAVLPGVILGLERSEAFRYARPAGGVLGPSGPPQLPS